MTSVLKPSKLVNSPTFLYQQSKKNILNVFEHLNICKLILATLNFINFIQIGNLMPMPRLTKVEVAVQRDEGDGRIKEERRVRGGRNQ